MLKKIFVVCIAFFGIFIAFKGFVSILDSHFLDLDNDITYKMSYNIGLVLSKSIKIIFGFFIIWQTYKWFCDEERNSSSIFKFKRLKK
ncbi:hypothetical protein FLAVO9AF_640018 [Flavobacterium sp. 9AF]|uniref:hypothetical protein n=1 Tax=Flavobacterium sp. 9AF TaxID=2653142 RepID=UPI0012F0BA49|nr:hypothetical protein [Flavobacterium sp. 9AF]VXC17261.1 hypothetical protein FLAVO9AF_640018 [Flavobacterium sp. 9AF]